MGFKLLFFLFFYQLNNSIIAQKVTFKPYTIIEDYDGTWSSITADMDGDGDLDVLGAASTLNDISWFENDGSPNKDNWVKYTIEDFFRDAFKAYPVDIDGDGDIDVIGSNRLYPGGTVCWWENDGNPNKDNWTKHIIDNNFHDARSIHVADMDSDGDLDVLGAAKEFNDISWWENNGNPANDYWKEYTIDRDFKGAYSVFAVDMDNDNDIDIVGAGAFGGGGNISWWENDGNPNKNNWTEFNIDNSFNYAASVYAADINNDGNIDVLGACRNGNEISWWENDGFPNKNNWTEYNIDNDFWDAASVYAADLDNDGDLDVIGASTDLVNKNGLSGGSGGVSWWENDGNPNSDNWNQHEIDNTFDGARAIYASDIDGDGDIDILVSAEQPTQSISWWENTSELNISENLLPTKITLHPNYPNPFNPITTLQFDLPGMLNVRLTIYSVIGKKVKTFGLRKKSKGKHSILWDGKDDNGIQVPAGMYFYELKVKDMVLTRKMTLLK